MLEKETKKEEPVAKVTVPTLVPWKTYLTPSLRFKFLATGVLFPTICLIAIVFGMNPGMEQPWQSGDLTTHLTVLLSFPSILFFYPLIFYSLVCLTIWCLAPMDFSKQFWVQLGLQTGTWLSFTFMILIMPMTGIASQIFAVIVIPSLAFLTYLTKLAIRKQFSIRYLLIITTIVAVLVAVISNDKNLRDTVLMTLVASGLLFIGAAPTTGLITFARASVAAFEIRKEQQNNGGFSQPSPKGRSFLVGLVSGWLVWCGLLLVSFRYAIEQQAIEYAKLPVANPNCYVSSAAAHGHPGIVGSHCELPEIGKVNLQMRRLKFLEFAISAAMPNTHHLIRSIYNRVGPPLAAVCRANIWFADFTFLLLKPIEWSAVLLQKTFRIPPSLVAKIYRQNG